MLASMSGNGGNGGGPQLPSYVFGEKPACSQYCPNLTFKQRVIGFGACAGIGWLLSLIGTLTLVGGTSASNIRAFICLYVFGNIIALCATGFLLGPASQCRQMFHPTRRYSTIFYLIMLIIVFALAVAKQNIGLILVMLIIEIFAALWYSISFIPFARKMIIGIARRSFCKPCFQVYDEAKGSVGGSDKNSSGAGGMMSTKGFTFLADDGQ